MNNETTFKTIARCAPTAWMNNFRKQMKAAGYTVKNDTKAQTCDVFMDETIVASAFKMGAMGWIVRADPKVVSAK